ncbi:MAG: HAD hydrolase-like protein [Patescibacteria group bacterium]|nr:HAD hydrolase-like protein [Patescibacteria group bacterium]
MIKLVAFDWNGTLFSDTKAIYKTVNQVLKLFKFGPIGLSSFQKHFDVPINKTYIRFGIPENEVIAKSPQVAKTFHSYYEPRTAKTRTRAFAKELLAWLNKNNIECVIFSNHIDEPIKKQLKRLKINKFFSKVLANSHIETSLKGRGKKDKLKNYLESQNILAKETLLIGDTVEEIEIGKELGAVTVAITHGNCSTVRLKAKKPDYIVCSLKDVFGIIKKNSG